MMRIQEQIGSFIFVVLATVFITFTGTLIAAHLGIQNKVISQELKSKNTITVSGTGEVYVKPDLAIITFSVNTEALDVEDALNENTRKMNMTIRLIKKEGVKDKDLKTTTFRIYPRYEHHNRKRVFVGYGVTQSLQVKIRDLNTIGQIIKGAVTAGANQAGGLQFTVDNREELEKQAREEAINKAKAKAKELASLLRFNLVRIIPASFKEGSQRPVY